MKPWLRCCCCCGAFDPLFDLGWAHAGWAEDPLWANPGDGGPVTSWRDAIGGTDPAQANAARQPTFLSAGINGLPAVRFDGNDWLTVTFPSLTEPISLVVIFELESTANNQYMISQTPIDPALHTDAGFWSMAGSHPITGSVGVNLDAHLLVGVSRDNLVPGNLYFDGGVDIGTNLESGLTSMGDIFLGVREANGLGAMTGSIAFWGVYPGDITLDPAWASFVAWATAHYALLGNVWGTENGQPWLTEPGEPWEMEYA